MPRITWRNFAQGLWLNGAPDAVPDSALRRATGIDSVRDGLLRSARAALAVGSTGANAIVRFASALYVGEGTSIFRNNIAIDTSQDGTRLSFHKQPPQPGLNDYLFVAGGGSLKKIDSAGAVTKWGIDPPADGITLTKQAQREQEIDDFDSAASFTALSGGGGFSNANLTDEGTIKVEGSNSLQVDTPAVTGGDTFEFGKAISKDLNAYVSGDKSPDQDQIEFWFRTSTPDAIIRLELTFGANLSGSFDQDAFTRIIQMADGQTNSLSPLPTVSTIFDVDRSVGIADPNVSPLAAGGHTTFDESDVVNKRGDFSENRDNRQLLEVINRTTIPRVANSWIRLRLPKATFRRTGTNNKTWSDVVSIRFTIVTDGTEGTFYFDIMKLRGGTGTAGAYKGQVTFLNSTTGSRSDPNPTPVLLENVDREAIIWGNLPVSADPQVDKVELWHTLGNGELFFKSAEVDNGTLLYVDETADFGGLFSGAHLGPSDHPDVLQALELQLDNAPPADTYEFVVERTFAGRTWFVGDTGTGGAGRAYYSPIGRPESVADFIKVSGTDERTTGGIVWNDALYIFTEQRVYRSTTEDEPFLNEEIFGVPGTTKPHTIRATPFGVLYQAEDGIRIFNGQTSELATFQAIAPVQRGVAVENVSAFVGESAAYARDDYWIADGAEMLALNLRTGTWRHFEEDVETLYSLDSEEVLAAIGDEVFALEEDAGDEPVQFEVQTYSQRTGADTKGYVRRIIFDIDTASQDVIPTLVLDDSEIVLAAINTATRSEVEFEVYHLSRLLAVRLTRTSTLGRILLYGIEADVYVPEGSDDRSIRPRTQQ